MRRLVIWIVVVVTLLWPHSMTVSNYIYETSDNLYLFYAKSYTTQTVLPGSTVNFPVVELDFGDGFQGHTGEYFIQKCGVYVFEFHGMTGPNGMLDIFLYRNDQHLVSAWANTSYRAMGALSAAIRVTAGDIITLRAGNKRDNSVTQLFADSGVKGPRAYASFSGYRIAK